MIRALITGTLSADPQERTTKNGNSFAFGRMQVVQQDGVRLTCTVVAFDDAVVQRMLQLKTGAGVSMAGSLKATIWQDREGHHRPALDLVADEISSTSPKPRKRESRRQREDEPQFDEGWLGA
jgi:single-stranded DNA-binding protein